MMRGALQTLRDKYLSGSDLKTSKSGPGSPFFNASEIASLKQQVNLRRLPKAFHESDDPNRDVPIVLEPDDFMVLVSGDPLRTNAYAFAHNGYLAFPVAKKIKLPKDWAERLRDLS